MWEESILAGAIPADTPPPKEDKNMKPTRKQLENLVRNAHISANKLNAQLVSKGWMKYGEFESKIKKELGIDGNTLKKLMVDYHYMHTLPFPRFRPVYDNYETWEAEQMVDTKNEYFPTGDSINKGFMDYRMPTVTGHVTKWVSPAGYESIKEVLGCHIKGKSIDGKSKVLKIDKTKETNKVTKPSVPKEHVSIQKPAMLMDWIADLDENSHLVVFNWSKSEVAYSGYIRDITLSILKLPVFSVSVFSYEGSYMLVYMPEPRKDGGNGRKQD